MADFRDNADQLVHFRDEFICIDAGIESYKIEKSADRTEFTFSRVTTVAADIIKHTICFLAFHNEDNLMVVKLIVV